MEWPDLIGEVREEIRGLRADVQDIKQEMEHYRGFVAGAAWCFAAIAGAVGFLWGLLFDN